MSGKAADTRGVAGAITSNSSRELTAAESPAGFRRAEAAAPVAAEAVSRSLLATERDTRVAISLEE